MRNMSFALTTQQVRNRQKTVTRRLGWKDLQPGTLLQPVVKGMGLKKGEKVEKIGRPIRVVNARREPLSAMTDDPDYGRQECEREGFPDLTPEQFVTMFRGHNGSAVNAVKGIVTRIEFEYVEEAH